MEAQDEIISSARMKIQDIITNAPKTESKG